jgi:hypothetical protein
LPDEEHFPFVSTISARGAALTRLVGQATPSGFEDVLFAFTITGHYRYLPDKG